jgi:dienelactone hydrolase
MGFTQRKTAPNIQHHQEKRFDGYNAQVISYDVEPNERIKAVVLTPDAPNGAGILAIHQHNGEYYIGKSEPAGWNLVPETDMDNKGNPVVLDPMYAYGRDLVQRGYTVVIPDMLCFEERRDRHFGDGYYAGVNGEAFEFVTLIQNGSSLMAKYMHDLTAAIDILAGFDGVDPLRLGAIGHSMGGGACLHITWLDERLKVGVSSCGFSTLRAVTRDKFNHNKAIYIPGFGQFGDNDDILADIAPRAFMFTAGTEDYMFPIDAIREMADKARKRYAELGASDNFDAYIFEGGHSFGDDAKEKVYKFMDGVLG